MTNTQHLNPAPRTGTGSPMASTTIFTPQRLEEGWALGSSPPGAAGQSQSHSLCRGAGQQGRRAKRVPHPGGRIENYRPCSWSGRGARELLLQVVHMTLVLCPQVKALSPDCPVLFLNSPASPRSTARPAEGSAWT